MSKVFVNAKDSERKTGIELDFDTGGAHVHIWLSSEEGVELYNKMWEALCKIGAEDIAKWEEVKDL